jgi:hypothetical protein
VWLVASDNDTLKQYGQSKLNISNVGVDELVVDVFRIAPKYISPDSLFLMTAAFIRFTDKTYKEIRLNGAPSNMYTGRQMGLFSRKAMRFMVQVMIDDKEIKKQKFKIQPNGEGVKLLADDVC